MRYRSLPLSTSYGRDGKRERGPARRKPAEQGHCAQSVLSPVSKNFHWDLLTVLTQTMAEQNALSDDFLKELRCTIRGRSLKGLDDLAQKSLRDANVNPHEAAIRRLLTRFLLKIESDIGFEKPDPLVKFLASEASNARQNEKFLSRTEIPEFEKIIKRQISLLLGRPPNLMGRHGPGASIGIKRMEATHLVKWRLPIAISSDACPHLLELADNNNPQLWNHLMGWPGINPYYSLIGEHHLEDILPQVTSITNFNRLAFVPKNYKSFRTIAIEPAGNLFMQLAIHDHLVRRLSSFGIFLEDQRLNQKRAREGSKTGLLATLDLSAASDTISYRVVEALLPSDWFKLLDDLRSKTYLLPGSKEPVPYHMFSSMGNGFTFCLMTVIFSALVHASFCMHGNGKMRPLQSAVYGDDLIVPATQYPTMLQLLAYYGFTVNEDKSFFDGPFRESCGEDYFHGHRVTPVYLRLIPKTAMDVFKLHNSLFNWFEDNLVSGFENISRFLEKYLNYRPYGPRSDIMDAYLFSNEKSTIRYVKSRAFLKGLVKVVPERKVANFPIWASNWAYLLAIPHGRQKVYPDWLRRIKKTQSSVFSFGYLGERIKLRNVEIHL